MCRDVVLDKYKGIIFDMDGTLVDTLENQLEIWENRENDKYENKVYMLPKHLDEKVARLHLAKIGVVLEDLTTEQADYINVPVDGPYKTDTYKY